MCSYLVLPCTGPCLKRKQEIELARQNELPLIGVSEPVCDADGYYSPVQCIGSVWVHNPARYESSQYIKSTNVFSIDEREKQRRNRKRNGCSCKNLGYFLKKNAAWRLTNIANSSVPGWMFDLRSRGICLSSLSLELKSDGKTLASQVPSLAY